MRARVLIRPKAGILDPQGIAVERALPALGFGGVSNVHVGRLVELDVEDADQLDAMCRKLLANPLIEDYEVVAEGDHGFGRPEADRSSENAGRDAPRSTPVGGA
ncbi:MAG TPA: phosphoribosylformylglycinamidine synthase subunit PurS [Solirubrobacteraceae bacterium]